VDAEKRSANPQGDRVRSLKVLLKRNCYGYPGCKEQHLPLCQKPRSALATFTQEGKPYESRPDAPE
jgi:hypothetical protein